MTRNLFPFKPRQLHLRFEDDEVWTKLPPATRQACQELLAQLLTAVLHHELELAKEVSDHERQD